LKDVNALLEKIKSKQGIGNGMQHHEAGAGTLLPGIHQRQARDADGDLFLPQLGKGLFPMASVLP